jgi:hypothetical protein
MVAGADSPTPVTGKSKNKLTICIRLSALAAGKRFPIDPPYWLRAPAITTQSLVNAAVRRHEERTYLPQVRAVDVPPPRRLTMFPHTSFSLPAGAGAEHAQEQSNARHSSAATVKVYVAETPDPRC